MEIIWYVEDGYANPGPQHCEVPDDELEGLTREEKRKIIEEYVQDEFTNTVSWTCDIDSYLEG